ncbi:hypothetical protein SH1V18_42610 [Vallitalea longa]|uniref:Uncharacterized protein n=1 Tax=Vallitalea longa TaxID=2936439 RepID=A0A9W5YFG2_9FIRM|nr:hypothetical protein [Vallitalea longa]GKX31781.1 hypothetical protein SH1V18_42610 [Vallitalea longa]
MKGSRRIILLLGIILTVTFRINSITVSCEESEIDKYSSYRLLSITAKQFCNGTVLDNDGKVWYVRGGGMAVGYCLEGPDEIPGMVNAVLIGDKISLLSNGTIWSWNVYPMVEHQLGVLPDNLAVSDIVKIFNYDDYIFILDNKGVLYYIYSYDKKIEMGCNSFGITKLLENVKDIGYGYMLDNNGKVYWFDITNENNKETIKLNFVMDNVKQLVSGEYYSSLCLNNSGEVFGLNNIKDIKKDNLSLPVKLTYIPLMRMLFDTCNPSIIFDSVGEDMDGNLVGLRFGSYPIETENRIEYKKLIIYDYRDIFILNSRHVIIVRNDNTVKDWFACFPNEFDFISPENLDKQK